MYLQERWFICVLAKNTQMPCFEKKSYKVRASIIIYKKNELSRQEGEKECSDLTWAENTWWVPAPPSCGWVGELQAGALVLLSRGSHSEACGPEFPHWQSSLGDTKPGKDSHCKITVHRNTWNRKNQSCVLIPAEPTDSRGSPECLWVTSWKA